MQTGGPVPEAAMDAMVPDIQEIAALHGWVTSRGQAQYAWEESRRTEALRAWVATAWATTPAQIYAWLKEERHVPVVMLEGEGGRMTGNLEEMDELLRGSWMPIMWKYGDGRAEEPSVDAFTAR